MQLGVDKGNLPVIHALRGLAALMVAFLHCSDWADGGSGYYTETSTIVQIGSHGRMGVYIFFVISGFVIPYSLIKNQYKIKNFFRFIAKRSIRIEIPYLTAMALGLICLYVLHLLFKVAFSFDFKRLLLNVFYLVPFSNSRWYSVIYWTLGVEFQFYITIAILIFLFVHKNKMIQTISLCLFLGLNLFELLKPDFSFIYSHAGVFTIGIITCLFYLKRVNWIQAIVVFLAAFCMTWKCKGLEMSLFAVTTALIIYFINFRTKLSDFLGNISYSLYLTHTTIGHTLIYLTLRIWKVSIPPPLLLAISLLLAICFAILFWWLVEKPSKNLAGKIKIGEKR